MLNQAPSTARSEPHEFCIECGSKPRWLVHGISPSCDRWTAQPTASFSLAPVRTQDIPSSVAQGSAAASRASRILLSEKWEIEPTIAVVWPERCSATTKGRACGICAKVCPYGAINIFDVKDPAEVVIAKCHGCGACVAECPEDAITQLHYTDAQILAQMRAVLADKPEEKILAFRCQWCSYGGADLAGTSHFEYTANERGLRVMCSARMDSDFIYEAYRLGAGAVLYSGCHPQDCHYITGQLIGAKRADRLKRAFERMEMTDGRFRVEWISAAEGDKYARVLNEMQATLDSIPPDVLHDEIERLKPEMEKRLKKFPGVPGVSESMDYSDTLVEAILKAKETE